MRDHGVALSAASADLPTKCRLAVIWIDWYAYHIARFRGIAVQPAFAEHVAGIELVGGIGVHAGLKFRADLPSDLPVSTLLPESSWSQAGQRRLAVRLWQHLSTLRPAAVLIPGYYTLPGLTAAVWAKTHGAVSILMTESTFDDHQRSAWKEGVKKLLLQVLFDKAITGGVAHRNYLRRLDFPEADIGSFYDVVDNDFFKNTAQQLRLSSTPEAHNLPAKYFLYVGRLSPEKNVDGLLASYFAYRAAGGTWALVLVGDGPSREAIQGSVSRSTYASDVHLAGLRGTSELPVFYSFAGCFVLPSTREPWGLVVNEAMASSLPVIVSDQCGCARDLVRPENGLVFEPSREEELTRLLLTVETYSSEERQRMGEASLRIIHEYNPQRFGEEVYRLVVAESSAN